MKLRRVRIAVAEQLRRLETIGVTDFLAVPFPAGADGKASIERTHALLVKLARR